MAERRKKYSAEFREQAVRRVIGTSRPIAVVARELGIVEGTLGNWPAGVAWHDRDSDVPGRGLFRGQRPDGR